MSAVKSCQTEIRVLYADVDQMGCVYHANYLKYFEQGRTELLRKSGWVYRDLEAAGIYFVVTKALCNYHSPAHYDDLLVVTATVKRVTLARIDHYYELRRKGDSLLLASGQTTLACVDAQGQVIPMPEGLKRKRKARNKSLAE